MTKQTNEFRKLSIEQLKEKKKEIEFLLKGCHRGTHPLVPIEKRGNLKKSIAIINTLIKEKQNGN